MKTVTSLSGGKSSGYMFLHWPTDVTLFAIVLTDDPETAPNDPAVLAECQRRIPGFIGTTESEITLRNVLRLEEESEREITWVCAHEGQSSPSWISDYGWMPKPLTFDRTIERKVGLPDKTKRWCTAELKVLAIWWHLYLWHSTGVGDMYWVHIGYRADEGHRWDKLQRCEANRIQFPTACPVGARDSRNKHRHQVFEYRVPHCPMIEAGVDQVDVLKFWAGKGWTWPAVSNCGHCFYHSDRELQHVATTQPAILDWAMRKEAERGATFDSHRSLEQRLSTTQGELFAPREFSCVCTD